MTKSEFKTYLKYVAARIVLKYIWASTLFSTQDILCLFHRVSPNNALL